MKQWLDSSPLQAANLSITTGRDAAQQRDESDDRFTAAAYCQWYADTAPELIGAVGGTGRTRGYQGRGALGPPTHCSR
jgi:hypothetical protein